MANYIYMVSDEDYSPIFVLEADKSKISDLKNGKTFRYITDERELYEYVKRFPNIRFMYTSDVEKQKAYELSDIFGIEKL